jgi:nucleotide-binding universal stress UspA family protein
MPSEQILKTIETEDIDLVVMANKGRGNISKFLFGSAAEKVFRHSPVPVISVRDPEKFRREQ